MVISGSVFTALFDWRRHCATGASASARTVDRMHFQDQLNRSATLPAPNLVLASDVAPPGEACRCLAYHIGDAFRARGLNTRHGRSRRHGAGAERADRHGRGDQPVRRTTPRRVSGNRPDR